MFMSRQALRRARGFTLIELLIALAAMAILAVMSWRGIDGMARTQAAHRERSDEVLVLQTALTQWSTDLDAAADFGTSSAIDWNAGVLRVLRRGVDPTGAPCAYVVGWAQRNGEQGPSWQRWQSPPLTTRAQWQQAWTMALSWGQNGSNPGNGATVSLLPLTTWSVAWYRNGVWAPAGDSSGTQGQSSTQTTTPAMPDGVRLILTLPPGAGLAGDLTRDWVRPTWGTSKTS